MLLAPPFIVNAAQIEAIVERLGDAVDAALGRTMTVARAPPRTRHRKSTVRGQRQALEPDAIIPPRPA